MTDEKQKKYLVLLRKAPYGSLYSFEGLQVILIMASYELDTALAFVDDGVYAITQNQNAKPMRMKQVSQTYPALPGLDMDRFYVHRESLEERGLSPDDLVLEVEVIDSAGLAALIEDQDVILPF
ncbi:MAG: sulfurtransferase complex subunit TusC [Anaerolineae bacterium]